MGRDERRIAFEFFELARELSQESFERSGIILPFEREQKTPALLEARALILIKGGERFFWGLARK